MGDSTRCLLPKYIQPWVLLPGLGLDSHLPPEKGGGGGGAAASSAAAGAQGGHGGCLGRRGHGDTRFLPVVPARCFRCSLVCWGNWGRICSGRGYLRLCGWVGGFGSCSMALRTSLYPRGVGREVWALCPRRVTLCCAPWGERTGLWCPWGAGCVPGEGGGDAGTAALPASPSPFPCRTGA